MNDKIVLEICTHNKRIRRMIETSKLSKSKLITRTLMLKPIDSGFIVDNITFNIERIVFNDAIEILWEYFENGTVRTCRKGHWVLALACYFECHDLVIQLKKMTNI